MVYFSTSLNSWHGDQFNPETVGGGQRTGECQSHGLGQYPLNQETNRAYQINYRGNTSTNLITHLLNSLWQNPTDNLWANSICNAHDVTAVDSQIPFLGRAFCTIHNPIAGQYLFERPAENAEGPGMFPERSRIYICDNDQISYTI